MAWAMVLRGSRSELGGPVGRRLGGPEVRRLGRSEPACRSSEVGLEARSTTCASMLRRNCNDCATAQQLLRELRAVQRGRKCNVMEIDSRLSGSRRLAGRRWTSSSLSTTSRIVSRHGAFRAELADATRSGLDPGERRGRTCVRNGRPMPTAITCAIALGSLGGARDASSSSLVRLRVRRRRATARGRSSNSNGSARLLHGIRAMRSVEDCATPAAQRLESALDLAEHSSTPTALKLRLGLATTIRGPPQSGHPSHRVAERRHRYTRDLPQWISSTSSTPNNAKRCCIATGRC